MLLPPRVSFDNSIESIESWCDAARRNGLLSLDQFADGERDPLARKGLRLLVDGNEPDAIRTILEVEITAKEVIKLRSRYNKIIAAATGRTEEDVLDDARRDFWLEAGHALEYGLVSKVIEKRSELPTS